MPSSDISPFDDDIPFADPQIQKDYEAALGRFLVVFNRIENTVSDTIIRALTKANLEGKSLEQLGQHLAAGSFDHRTHIFRLITTTTNRASIDQLAESMRVLARQRNTLAHGHFNQNPFDGSFDIRTVRGQAVELSAAQIDGLTETAERIHEQLKHIEVTYEFDDLGPEDLPD